jgi:ubiquinone/menaquinone biosynthesis C-methylase UbiE
MDEVRQTHEKYDSDRDAFIEKYLSESGVEAYGDAFVDALDGGRILDLGCGPGVDTTVLVGDGFDVVGFDITRPFLDAASDRLADLTGQQTGQSAFVHGDMRTLPFASSSFDGIWASGSFHHVPRDQAAQTVAECRRTLRSDGHLFLSAKRKPTGSETGARHFEYYGVEEFCAMLDDGGFEVGPVDTTEYWVSVVASA